MVAGGSKYSSFKVLALKLFWKHQNVYESELKVLNVAFDNVNWIEKTWLFVKKYQEKLLRKRV